MSNINKYGKKRKTLLWKKYQFDGDAKTRLEQYFGKDIDPPFAISQLDKAIKDGMDSLGMDLNQVIRNYLFTGEVSKQQLIEYFNTAMKLNEADSKVMAEYVSKRFDELTSLQKQKNS